MARDRLRASSAGRTEPRRREMSTIGGQGGARGPSRAACSARAAASVEPRLQLSWRCAETVARVGDARVVAPSPRAPTLAGLATALARLSSDVLCTPTIALTLRSDSTTPCARSPTGATSPRAASSSSSSCRSLTVLCVCARIQYSVSDSTRRMLASSRALLPASLAALTRQSHLPRAQVGPCTAQARQPLRNRRALARMPQHRQEAGRGGRDAQRHASVDGREARSLHRARRR